MNLATRLAQLSEVDRTAFLADLTPKESAGLLYDWEVWARPDQLPPPGDWRTWLILAGRGYGKTRVGGETVKKRVASGTWSRIALVGESVADVRDVMIKGESGLLACYPASERPRYIESKRSVEWPNGAIATTYSGVEPDQLRGPQHDGFWADELAKYQYPQEAWDNLQFGLRLGRNPHGIVTTTPKPIPTIKDIIKDPSTFVTRGDTYANAANLPPATLAYFTRKYAGTRLGRQELYAEILDDAPGALWIREWFDSLRVSRAPELRRIVVAIDPAVSANENSDETGIGAVGICPRGELYVLADRSLRASPDGWARRAIALFFELSADCIVAEVNNGGDMVESTIRNAEKAMRTEGSLKGTVRVKQVRASKGKSIRAEPIAAIYEQRRAHHVGTFGDLEDQMCMMTTDEYLGSGSPDRVDWLVWGATELTENGIGILGVVDYYKSEHQIRVDDMAKRLGKLAGPVEIAKVATSDNTLRCKFCESILVSMRGDWRHCNQCGKDWTVVEQPSLPRGGGRTADTIKAGGRLR